MAIDRTQQNWPTDETVNINDRHDGSTIEKLIDLADGSLAAVGESYIDWLVRTR